MSVEIEKELTKQNFTNTFCNTVRNTTLGLSVIEEVR